jgi:hypothetical protein
MKKNILQKKKWMFLDILDDFEGFLQNLESPLEASDLSGNELFSEWVNHSYNHLLKDLGPINGPLFS